ncbi:hypothetical protein E4T56_gene13032 [Termitomyces sp. T112]|nr:hypothetical protein E4T56_gene13032 [Termitomyces sp. T112]KAH0580751.1 hypothetical protein H2248_002235 [Termitomyces sp. 'cryptogamus']
MNKNGTGPPVPPPKYLNDFSKALANEVRILLAEVGKLRDERRALQYEIAELMQMKSKHGSGGEFAPDWRPPPPLLEAAPAPPEATPPTPVHARPGWRTVHPRQRPPRTVPKAIAQPPPPAPFAVPSPAPEPPMPAWAQWRPNPLLAPTPVNAAPMSPPLPPPSRGLFGPRTPPPS